MIVTLTGGNDFLRTHELAALAAAFVAEHGDMAVERLDGEETPADRLRESVESLPFLTPRKLVILREPSRQKAFAEQIEAVLAVVADSTDLILVEPKLDKRLAYYKTLKKQTDFREFAELDTVGLASWASQYAAEQGGQLSPTDARRLLDRVGSNQQLLKSELDKLLQYDPHITGQSIELLVERLPQSTVFELLDAAFAGNHERALQLYHEQRALKVEPLAILAMLVWQLHVLAVVKAAGQRSPDDIARGAKLSPFVVRKSQHITHRLSGPQLKSLLADLLNIDVRLKTTAIDPDEALQLFFLKVGQRA